MRPRRLPCLPKRVSPRLSSAPRCRGRYTSSPVSDHSLRHAAGCWETRGLAGAEREAREREKTTRLCGVWERPTYDYARAASRSCRSVSLTGYSRSAPLGFSIISVLAGCSTACLLDAPALPPLRRHKPVLQAPTFPSSIPSPPLYFKTRTSFPTPQLVY